MKPLDFLETARDLATSSARRPRQTNLRRAVSTTYYALFHCLAKCCADMVVGGPGSDRSRPAWRQTYRALGHGTARKRCEHQKRIRRFPVEIQDLANVFVDMQKKRHGADYDPDAVFPKRDVLQDIDEAETVIRGFPAASAKDRRAFVVYLLLDIRS